MDLAQMCEPSRYQHVPDDERCKTDDAGGEPDFDAKPGQRDNQRGEKDEDSRMRQRSTGGSFFSPRK